MSHLIPTRRGPTGRPCRVALLGFGTVGRSVARLLLTRHSSRFTLTTIFNRQVARKKVDWVPSSVRWTDRIEEALESADIVVELVGGVEPAGEWVRAAITAGKPVATANKQLIAECGDELVQLARRHGVALRFEASVGGGIPVVRGIEDGLAGDRLVSLAGIVNGTCNYILTRMDEGGAAFGDALAEAQRLGFAEADPTADVDGYDARAKLVVLARLALGVSLDPASVPCRSIAQVTAVDFELAREAGGTIRQVSSLERDPPDDEAPLTAWVSPAFVPVDSLFAGLHGPQNVVITRGEFGGETTFVGNGAGGDPTAVAVVSDVIAIANGGLPPQVASSGRRQAARDFVARRYMRVRSARHQVASDAIAPALARRGLFAEAVLETVGDAGGAVAFMLAPTTMGPIEEALADLEGAGSSLAVLVLPVIESNRARAAVETAGIGAATGRIAPIGTRAS
jgi:homoserine dehydrogenase